MANPPVTNVEYTKTYPIVEHVGSVLLEGGAALLADHYLSDAGAIGAATALEAINFRDHSGQVIRNLTADKTTTYADGTRNVSVSNTHTWYSPQGDLTGKTHRVGTSIIHNSYNNNALSSTTYYPNSGGYYKYNSKGQYQGSGCNIQ